MDESALSITYRRLEAGGAGEGDGEELGDRAAPAARGKGDAGDDPPAGRHRGTGGTDGSEAQGGDELIHHHFTSRETHFESASIYRALRLRYMRARDTHQTPGEALAPPITHRPTEGRVI